MLSWDESSIYHAERKVTAVRFSKWHIAPEKPEAQACLRAAGYPYLVAAVLSARGIETPEQAAAFLEREDKLTISPFLMRDMDKAAARVQQRSRWTRGSPCSATMMWTALPPPVFW